MIIREIDHFRCDGCGVCERVCIADVIQMKESRACIVYSEDCNGCMICEILCPRGAIEVHPTVKMANGRC
jgi:MinD superfamily P-loop ATPase